MIGLTRRRLRSWAVRRAAPNHAKLLLIEAVMPNEPGPNWTKTLDILMLGLFGGSQRTSIEYSTLLSWDRLPLGTDC
jgi:O-methyltransferase domain